MVRPHLNEVGADHDNCEPSRAEGQDVTIEQGRETWRCCLSEIQWEIPILRDESSGISGFRRQDGISSWGGRFAGTDAMLDQQYRGSSV